MDRTNALLLTFESGSHLRDIPKTVAPLGLSIYDSDLFYKNIAPLGLNKISTATLRSHFIALIFELVQGDQIRN